MPDIFTQRKRSAVMATIRSHGNMATELRLIRIFRAYGIAGWRRGSRLPGKPDFVFPNSRVAVFVDGCFWHGCPKHAHPAQDQPRLLAKEDRPQSAAGSPRELRAA